MLVRCDIPEQDNIVTVGLVKYVFRKNDAGHLVCNVEDEAARNTLLGRPEFSLYTHEEEPDDPDFGKDVGHAESAPPALLTREYLQNLTYEELKELFAQRFGKAAHPSSKHETLVDRLAE